MTSDLHHPAISRLRRDPDVETALEVLSDRLPGSDLTSLLMEVNRRRSARRTASDVLEHYRRDRFTALATIEAHRLRAVEDRVIEAAAGSFEFLVLSPVVPLGTHSAIAGVSQNNVITTTRGSEVAADPTNALALEAALRRRTLLDADPRSATTVLLAALQRIVRGQRFEGPRSFAHFSLFGAVTAGRDIGHHVFEIEAVTQHITTQSAVMRSLGASDVHVQLTDLGGGHTAAIEQIDATLAGTGIDVDMWPEREGGRNYYVNICFM